MKTNKDCPLYGNNDALQNITASKKAYDESETSTKQIKKRGRKRKNIEEGSLKADVIDTSVGRRSLREKKRTIKFEDYLSDSTFIVDDEDDKKPLTSHLETKKGKKYYSDFDYVVTGTERSGKRGRKRKHPMQEFS